MFIFCLLIPMAGISQNSKEPRLAVSQGIHFESGLSWTEIRTKAKAENKFIFMDCYATWCGPCRFMSDSIFSQKEVGDYMNGHFINVAVQMDMTTKDEEDTRYWYKDAKLIGDKYSINTYPTYLFFSPDGRSVHRVIGATGKEGKYFVDKAREAFDSNKQYYTYIENYKMHLNDSLYLRNALAMSLNAKDVENAEEISDAYVSCLRDPFHEYNLRIIHDAVRSSKDKGFALFLNNTIKIDSILRSDETGKDWVWPIIADEEISPLFSGNLPISWEKVSNGLKTKYPTLNEKALEYFYSRFESEILAKEIRHMLYKKGAALADWAEISNKIKQQYPGYDPDKMITTEKPKYYEYKKMWPECIKEVLSCVSKYGNQLNNGELNAFAWDVFMHSNDRDLLSSALEWSGRTIPDSSDSKQGIPEYVDTYANLLYKIGNRERAVLWERKAMALAELEHDPGFLNNLKNSLKRMEDGENTWEGRNDREEYQ